MPDNADTDAPDWWHLADVVADTLELLRDNGNFDMAREHPEHPDDKRGAALMALRAYQLALADLARLSPDSRVQHNHGSPPAPDSSREA